MSVTDNISSVIFLLLCIYSVCAKDNVRIKGNRNQRIVSLCRQNPTWRDNPEISWELCSQVMNWKRRSRFWEGSINQTVFSSGYMNEDNEIALHECVKEILTETNRNHDPSWDLWAEPFVEQIQPSPRNLDPEDEDYEDQETPVVVEVSSTLNEYEVNALRAVGSCVRQHFPSRQFEVRSFGKDDDQAMGGNDCTYMAAFLQLLAPGVMAQIQSVANFAWMAAGWNTSTACDTSDPEESEAVSYCPDPRSLGVRTTELLSYQNWKYLEGHADSGSAYTVVVTLSDPTIGFDGGDFYIEAPNSTMITIRPQRLSSVVFLSETLHGVNLIERGHRETFATELWIYDDVIFGENRPSFVSWSRTLRNLKENTDLLDDFEDPILEYEFEDYTGYENNAGEKYQHNAFDENVSYSAHEDGSEVAEGEYEVASDGEIFDAADYNWVYVDETLEGITGNQHNAFDENSIYNPHEDAADYNRVYADETLEGMVTGMELSA